MIEEKKPSYPVQEALAPFGFNSDTVKPLRDARRSFERTYIVAVLEQHGWRMGEAARALGLQRPNLYRKARQLSIPLRSLASAGE